MKIIKIQFNTPVNMPDGRFVDVADSRYDISLHESSLALKGEGFIRHYPLDQVAHWDAQAPQSAARVPSPEVSPAVNAKVEPRGSSKAK